MTVLGHSLLLTLCVILSDIRQTYGTLFAHSRSGIHVQSSASNIKAAPSTFSFASYYGDHMVLQKAPKRATIWGYARAIPGTVSVTLSGKGTVNTTVKRGPAPSTLTWTVQLPPVEAGGPYKLTATSTDGTITLSDILFGDVWICSGQSNMQFTLDMGFNATKEVEEAKNYPTIRVFTVTAMASKQEQYDLLSVAEKWSLPSNASLAHGPWNYFSAVCWLYAKKLSHYVKYPIGLIDTSYGGTIVEAWSSPDSLAKCHLNKTIKSIPHSFSEEVEQSVNPNHPSFLWNSMIRPLVNMTIYGVIWYQGESNAMNPSTIPVYNCTFPAMIDDWRTKFNSASQGQTNAMFPFGFVQLAPWRNNSSLTFGFPDIRWHQTADYGYAPNYRMKNVFMAVAMDLPDFNSPWTSIHPRDKQDVAERLYLAGLAVAYNETGVKYQGPFPSLYFMFTPVNHIVIIYDDYKTKLDIRSKEGFEICCSNFTWSSSIPCTSSKAVWYPAPIISHDNTTVSIAYGNHCQSLFPGALRYAWRESPCPFKGCAIYSLDNGLPGPPFYAHMFNNKFVRVTWT